MLLGLGPLKFAGVMLMATVAVAALALPPGATSTEEIPIGTILSQWGSYREVATAMQAGI